ncbi:MFS general substrate transporter [Fomitiporia mediterranea MF3/22]|uniref:MFS general substrate transporter n=1 Tax=Fomitiporia mediterranea (strain MF3/22) TaxID=694068 RepID=UPI0004408ED8|nr:MFS general substrate transporter [Fomitiporia mediterranea MF3/22]EJD02383.1 MFS general substrate transporter [Fomitiporia mediterranea MF3/22]
MSLSRPQSREHSRPGSRPRNSRHASTHTVPYLPQDPEALLLPEGSVTEETVELLHEFVHPHSHRHDKRRADTDATIVAETIPVDSEQEEFGETPSENDEDDIEGEDWDALKKRPWYRRPSPLWLLCVTPLSSIAMSAAIAPRVEVYTYLACLEHRPEYTTGTLGYGLELYQNNDTAPVAFTEDKDSLIDAWMSPYLGPSVFTMSGESIGMLKESKDTNRCASDPVVQAAAAKIIAVMTTTMGILSCLTTAFWGSLSDRYGRLRVVGISVIGLLFNDFIFILVYFCSRQLPGGYWFLLLGPIIEGILGGITSMVAALHAYLADCTSPGNRTHIFSLGAGLLFVGMAFGPTIGSILIHVTHTPLSVFYLSTAVHALFAMYTWVIVPESLPERAQRVNRMRVERRRFEERQAEEIEDQEQCGGRVKWIRLMRRMKRVFKFLSPLSVFAPEKVPSTPGAFLGKRRRDWSLTFIALGFGCSALVMASYQYKFQYAAATFGWSSEELGYWLSLVGASRAFYLTIILPLIIKFFNRPKQAIQLPVEPSEPLINSHSSDPSSSTVVSSPSPPSSPTYIRSSSPLPLSPPSANTTEHTHPSPSPHTPTFDLHLARFSLLLECICFSIIPLAPSAMSFSALGCLAAWGGGFNPAVQALALELYARRGNVEEGSRSGGRGRGMQRGGRGKNGGERGEAETGRLFGALSVVQAMGQQIFGPALFGLTYMHTVAFFPSAIFWVSTLCVSIGLVFICFVRLPRESRGNSGDMDLEVVLAAGVGIEREDTLVNLGDDAQQAGKATK